MLAKKSEDALQVSKFVLDDGITVYVFCSLRCPETPFFNHCSFPSRQNNEFLPMRTLWKIFSNCGSGKCKNFNSIIAPPFLLDRAGLPFRLLRIRIFRLLKDDVAGLLSASTLRVCAIFSFASRSIANKSERRFLIEIKSLILHRSTAYMTLIQHRRVVDHSELLVVLYAC